MRSLEILVLLVALPVPVAVAAEPAIRHVDVFKSGTEGYHTFRMQTLARFSDDNGTTWSEPIELTAVARDLANKENGRASVVGPGGAICTSKGRLVAPVWKTVPFGVFTIYSDDHGRTWQRGEMVPGQNLGDENQLVELADGRILVDVRQQSGPHRWLATSRPGGCARQVVFRIAAAASKGTHCRS